MIETGITIEGIAPYVDENGIVRTAVHSFKDLGLILATYYIPEPKVKDRRVSIPFASGSVDLTEGAGYIPYEDRDGVSFEFIMKNKDYYEYHAKIQKLNNMLHGRKLKVILDSDPSYYYFMRLHLNEDKHNKIFSKVKITGSADPFKYDLIASNEPWLWNPFNFYTGEIQETTADVIVNGTKDILIRAGGYSTSPTFYVYESTNLAVTFDENTFQLPKDNTKAYETYRFPQIKVGTEEATLRFTGTGKVSVEYRGRYL